MQRYTKFIGDNLPNLSVQTLAHFSATMVDLHAAICVNVQQGAGLVQMLSSE